jgi:phenylpyruvate tautomerase PptA (4-oxalocrotonate tautomerase family)
MTPLVIMLLLLLLLLLLQKKVAALLLRLEKCWVLSACSVLWTRFLKRAGPLSQRWGAPSSGLCTNQRSWTHKAAAPPSTEPGTQHQQAKHALQHKMVTVMVKRGQKQNLAVEVVVEQVPLGVWKIARQPQRQRRWLPWPLKLLLSWRVWE